MGHMVEAKARAGGHSIITIINEHHSGLDAKHLSETLRAADVAIDFTAADSVMRNVDACMSANVPLVEGTTGWQGQIEEVEKRVLGSDGAFVYGSNFSIGVNFFYRIVEHATELLAKFPEYEVFMEEQHHSRKKDAPSGTALKIKEIVSEYIDADIPVTSTRAGHIPGTHRVGFDGPADQILLEHSARSRESFAAGAIMAAEWIIGKKGFFEFTTVMDEFLAK